MKDLSDIDASEYVPEHREELVDVIRHSSDPFARACAWVLLDEYSDDPDVEALRDELDAVRDRGAGA